MAFCWAMSQVIGWMYWQSWPEGQQIIEVALPRAMHFVDDGQQKFEGRLVSPQEMYVGSPQELEPRVRRPRACAALMAVVRAVAEGTVNDMRQTVASFDNVVLPMFSSGKVPMVKKIEIKYCTP